MTSQSRIQHNRYLLGRENKNGEKSLFHLKPISSFIFQAILLKLLGYQRQSISISKQIKQFISSTNTDFIKN